MAMTKAEIHIRGFLGNDAELFEAKSGKKFYRANVAVRTGKDKTSWFPVLFSENWKLDNWKKGDLVDIEGNFSTNEYEKDGQKRISFTVFAKSALNITETERYREKKNAELAEGEEFVPEFFDEEELDEITIE